MSSKSKVRELRVTKNGTGSISEIKHWLCQSNSHIALNMKLRDIADDIRHLNPHDRQGQASTGNRDIQQGQWANLPPELLLDIIRRVEKSETSWPDRAVVVYCASVCKSWRCVTKEVIKTPQQCGRITFPISLKQPGPRDYPIHCFILRNRRTSTFQLYSSGSMASKCQSNKFLLAAEWKRWFEFAISLSAYDFSPSSDRYVGKLRSNVWGTKFTIYDTQPPHDAEVQPNCRPKGIFNSKKVLKRSVPTCSHLVTTISYERLTRMPRRVHCIMNSIPVSAIQEGGNPPTPTSLPQIDQPFSPSTTLNGKSPMTDSYSPNRLLEKPRLSLVEPLILKNKAARWDEQYQSWCLDFMGQNLMSSRKNFQLVAAIDPSHCVSLAEQERVILQFGKIGEDMFIMDYSYPLSAFQAFAICLTSLICNI